MLSSNQIESLVHGALGGVTKTQIKAQLINNYNYTKKEANEFVNGLEFKSRPLFINYNKTYNTQVDPNAKRLPYPLTKIYEYPNFLSVEECKKLIELADQIVRPSCVANPKDEIITSDYRTSWTADFDWTRSSFINQLDCKIAKALGISPFLGEILQVQRYEPGQYYKEHCDYFHPFTSEYKVYTEWMGQRTWTFMVYLNDVEAGGETYFKYLNLKVKPEQGKAIFWSNLDPVGIPNYKTMHEAMPPTKGNKYVITKWCRSWSLI